MGSIVIALGASALDFSSTLNLDAADKPPQVAQYLQQISNVKGVQGVYFTIIGLVILLGSIPLCWNKINKLKSDKSNPTNHDALKNGNDDSDEDKRSLENLQLQVQIEELRLEITKLKNQVETEKWNQMKSKGKTRDSKR